MSVTLPTALEIGNAILDAQFSTTIAKTETLPINMREFPLVAIMAMLSHGAQRKFNDATGGADKSAAEKVSIAKAMIADFKNGVVAKRGEGATADQLDARKAMRSLMDKASIKTLNEMEPVAQIKKLDELIAANADIVKQVVAENRAEAARVAARNAGLVGKVKISL